MSARRETVRRRWRVAFAGADVLHCLLIEGDDRLILVDTGLGVEDVNEPRRLG